MKNIAVSQNKQASADGITVTDYCKDHTYTMPDKLAEVFVNEKWGTYEDEPTKEEAAEAVKQEHKLAAEREAGKTEPGKTKEAAAVPAKS